MERWQAKVWSNPRSPASKGGQLVCTILSEMPTLSMSLFSSTMRRQTSIGHGSEVNIAFSRRERQADQENSIQQDGQIAQLVKCLTCKREDQSLLSIVYKQNQACEHTLGVPNLWRWRSGSYMELDGQSPQTNQQTWFPARVHHNTHVDAAEE